jgi:hypothetical protein
MHREEIYVETGKSVAGVSGSTWFGVLLGDTKSVNSINRWIFNTNQRTYKRKKLVWSCYDCAGYGKKFNESSKRFFYYFVASIVVFLILVQIITS